MTDRKALIDRIDRELPQTQCGQCDFAGCRPYAEAIADGRADINQCPPGGDVTVRALADLLERAPKPVDPSHGEVKTVATVAWVDEDICIGCTRCIQACPVDAIVGAAKQMHTVITAHCTGCELCLAPCPVDCIYMLPAPADMPYPAAPRHDREQADLARARYEFRQSRLQREQAEREARRRQKKAVLRKPSAADKKAAIAAALERVKRKRAALQSNDGH